MTALRGAWREGVSSGEQPQPISAALDREKRFFDLVSISRSLQSLVVILADEDHKITSVNHNSY
jgi:hypothetical protein